MLSPDNPPDMCSRISCSVGALVGREAGRGEGLTNPDPNVDSLDRDKYKMGNQGDKITHLLSCCPEPDDAEAVGEEVADDVHLHHQVLDCFRFHPQAPGPFGAPGGCSPC